MELINQISKDIILATKNKEVDKKSSLKQIKTYLVTYQKDNKVTEDEHLASALEKLVKQKNGNITSYEDAIKKLKDSNSDNVKELLRLEIIERDLAMSYLPEKIRIMFTTETLSEDVLIEKISEIISENNYSGMKDMGKIMGKLKQIPGVDMKIAGSLVKSKLQ